MLRICYQLKENLRKVSCRSSFLRLIRSFSVSASRRAAWILACISSPDIALELAIATEEGRSDYGGQRCGEERGGKAGGAVEVEFPTGCWKL